MLAIFVADSDWREEKWRRLLCVEIPNVACFFALLRKYTSFLCASWMHRLFDQWLNPLCNSLTCEWRLLRAVSVPVGPQVALKIAFSTHWPIFLFFFSFPPFSLTCNVSFISVHVVSFTAAVALRLMFGQGVFDLICRSTGWPSHPFSLATINQCVPSPLSSFQNKKKCIV